MNASPERTPRPVRPTAASAKPAAPASWSASAASGWRSTGRATSRSIGAIGSCASANATGPATSASGADRDPDHRQHRGPRHPHRRAPARTRRRPSSTDPTSVPVIAIRPRGPCPGATVSIVVSTANVTAISARPAAIDEPVQPQAVTPAAHHDRGRQQADHRHAGVERHAQRRRRVGELQRRHDREARASRRAPRRRRSRTAATGGSAAGVGRRDRSSRPRVQDAPPRSTRRIRSIDPGGRLTHPSTPIGRGFWPSEDARRFWPAHGRQGFLPDGRRK